MKRSYTCATCGETGESGVRGPIPVNCRVCRVSVPTGTHRVGPTEAFLQRQQQIKALYDSGRSIPAIAKDLGISKQRVHQILRRPAEGLNYQKLHAYRARGVA